MTLAQRVRDHRYAKGWGPDELASRASISRTALYQIESGKTEQPRAGTLRRIAQALDIPTEALLGPNLGVVGVGWSAAEPDARPAATDHAPPPGSGSTSPSRPPGRRPRPEVPRAARLAARRRAWPGSSRRATGSSRRPLAEPRW